jgi:hypothetical protein
MDSIKSDYIVNSIVTVNVDSLDKLSFKKLKSDIISIYYL